MIRLTRVMRPLVTAAGHLFALWMRTVRVRVLMPDGSAISPIEYAGENLIFAMTERDLLALASFPEGRAFLALVADGNDGDWAAALAAPLGCRSIRGSSLRYGLDALLILVRTLKAGSVPAAIVVDGPLGPPGEVKEGVIVCAAHTRRAIVPLVAAAAGKIVFRGSWAAHYLPLPFARVVIAAGHPIHVRSNVSRPEVAECARAVGSELRRLRDVALGELRTIRVREGGQAA